MKTVPLAIYHRCPSVPDKSFRAIELCLKLHFEQPDHPLGCGYCSAIQEHLVQFGMRHKRRVPLADTNHSLVFKDEETGKEVVTSVREWRCTERLGNKWFTKMIDGKFYAFDIYTARRMGIDGAFPKLEPVMKGIDPAKIYGSVGGSGKKRTAHTSEPVERTSVPRRIVSSSPAPKPKPTLGLSDLSKGSLIEDGMKRIKKEAAKRLTEIASLRAQHVKKHGQP